MRPESVEPGLGPQRTIFAATPQGREAAERWLDTPVAHVRDIRSHLLLKLALLDRAETDPADLLRRQRAVLEPIARAIEAGQPRARFRRDPAGLAPGHGSGRAGIPGYHRPAPISARAAARLTERPARAVGVVTGFAVSP